jgi:hypothetical protein
MRRYFYFSDFEADFAAGINIQPFITKLIFTKDCCTLRAAYIFPENNTFFFAVTTMKRFYEKITTASPPATKYKRVYFSCVESVSLLLPLLAI